MTTLPALSTPCTWNTFLARSTPMVLTCMWTTPSGDSLFNDHPLAHSMPGAGVVHHIIRVAWPDHGDFRSTLVNGHSQDRRGCLKGARFGFMHRYKQLKLFDQFVGAGEPKMRACDLAELARVKRVNF